MTSVSHKRPKCELLVERPREHLNTHDCACALFRISSKRLCTAAARCDYRGLPSSNGRTHDGGKLSGVRCCIGRQVSMICFSVRNLRITTQDHNSFWNRVSLKTVYHDDLSVSRGLEGPSTTNQVGKMSFLFIFVVSQQ